jgi:hypothetical protein
MFRADQFRAKAAESGESARNTDVPSEIRKFQASMESFRLLAKNEDWLADNFDKMIHSRGVLLQDEVVGEPLDRRSVADVEEHILRCLGAAVITQWKMIPTKLRRELFDTAGSLGALPQTAALRGQIARFLHSHRDEKPSDFIAKANDEGKA